MRKFLPRFFNVISFILAWVVLWPWRTFGFFFYAAANRLRSGFLYNLSSWLYHFFLTYEWVKFFFIPAILVLLSLAYLIHSSVDKAKNKVASKPLTNMALDPIAYFGMASALAGLLTVIFVTRTGTFSFKINAYEWYFLAKFIPEAARNSFNSLNPNLLFWVGIAFYAVLFIGQFLLVVLRKNLSKRGFFGRFFSWILYLVLAFIAMKGLYDSMVVGKFTIASGGFTNLNLLVFMLFPILLSPNTAAHVGDFAKQLAGLGSYSYPWGIILFLALGVILLVLVLYIVIASLKKRNDKKAEKALREEAEEKEEATEEFVPNVAEEEEDLFDLPEPEEEIVTEVTEKTVIKQIIYEKSDLNDIYETEFGFRNESMVRGEGENDYFVSKQKFLTLSNGNKTLSFRLDLDKAIRLMIQYPLVGKDKYENHKIWFKIENSDNLSKDVLIQIIKDAYETVLNNE